MGEANMFELPVPDGKINGYDGIRFKEGEQTNNDLLTKLKEVIPPQPTDGGRRRKRRTKVKSKKRANRRRRTRYQH
jgi:hypothetical protein